MIEAMVFSLLAALLALALAEVLIPLANALGGVSVTLCYFGEGGVLPWLIPLVLLVAVLAGLYPALALSRFQPATVLSSARSPGGGRREAAMRGTLIGAQFVVAVIFLICTLVIGSEARLIRTADRGFAVEGLALLDNLGAVLLRDRQLQVLGALRRTPGVLSATLSFRSPGGGGAGGLPVRRVGARSPPTLIFTDVVGDDYLQTYGGRVVAGRILDSLHRRDDIDGPFEGMLQAAKRGINVVLNEKAVSALGFASPADAVGRSVELGDAALGFSQAQVVGVVANLRFGSPLEAVEPVIYAYDSRSRGGGVGAVRFAGAPPGVMIERLKRQWSTVAADVPFQAMTAEEHLSPYYLPDEQRARLFSIGSALALAIAGVGLYGLAAFTTARRVREIGVRKTLGASTRDILVLLTLDFLRPVALANLIAWPVAYLAMRAWLSGFDQRIALSPLYFVLAAVLSLLVAAVAVGSQALGVARSEPARALRHD
jgi:putative ABC transport system permease protein